MIFKFSYRRHSAKFMYLEFNIITFVLAIFCYSKNCRYGIS